MINADGEYEMSEGSERACAFHWPDSLKTNHPLFSRRMLELQCALIKHHMVLMPPSSKARAQKTLRYLNKRMKEM